MKGNITLGMLVIAISTSAQIQNGSFESGGVFNTNGWTPTACAVIGSTTDAPDGDHALVMASSSVNVCNYAVDSNRLVQVLPWVNDGDLLRLQWWWHKGAPNEYAIAWLGTVENGTFTSQYSFTTSANNWAMFTMDEEIQVGPGQQAALALGGGFALQDGGSSYFDMIEVSLVTGLAEDHVHLPMRPNLFYVISKRGFEFSRNGLKASPFRITAHMRWTTLLRIALTTRMGFFPSATFRRK